jgi:hypothetical protein
MTRRFVAALVAALLTVIVAGSAGAASNPSGTGQPSQTCLESQQTAMEPGRAAAAPGSAFNETRPGTAGTVYAGNGANTGTPANAAAVSQYDVACYQVTTND